MFLNTPWVIGKKKQHTREIRKYFELNENKIQHIKI